MKGLPGTRKGRTWIAPAVDGGGLKGVGRGHVVFVFILSAVPTAAFFAPFDPSRVGVGTRGISGQLLGDAGGRGAKRAPGATFY